MYRSNLLDSFSDREFRAIAPQVIDVSEFFDKWSRLSLDIFEGYEEELRVTYIVERTFLFAWNRDDISSLPESTDDFVYEWSVMSRIPGDIRDIFGTIRQKTEIYT